MRDTMAKAGLNIN